MNKTISIIVVVLLVVIGGYFLLRGGNQTPQESGTQTPSLGVPAPGFEDVPEAVVSPQGEAVAIRNHKITVPTLTVNVGTTVTWINEDDLAGFPYDNHSPTSGTIDPSGSQGKIGVVPNSGSGLANGTFAISLPSGESQSFTFTKAGTYTYYIAEHPLVSGEGKVIVKEQEETTEPISMSAGSFFFSSKTLGAKVGEKVALDITATGQHTFTIDELGVNVPLPHGKTTRVEFTPSKSGTFTYYCAIPGHREAGQIGSLTVE